MSPKKPSVKKGSLAFPLEEYRPPPNWVCNGDRCGGQFYNSFGWEPSSLGGGGRSCTELYGIYHPNPDEAAALRLKFARKDLARSTANLNHRLGSPLDDPLAGISTHAVCELILVGDVELLDE
jgi:hypothetical protein